MAEMTNPHDGLISFQQALQGGLISPKICTLHKDLSIFHDDAEGTPRLTYAFIEDGVVKVTVVYVKVEPIDGAPCFGIGYAVAEPFRKQGLAKKVIEKTIDEIKIGFKNHIPKFYIEAIVGESNIPSQKIAASLISSSPTAITDRVSGLPAFQYVRLIN
ncbi:MULTISPECIES: GNAT family N-acetyltransferase [Yersinia]|uniref:GNAT family N-acetyltransferase n=1 Tax=Yersinia TaxID=629 RepID=UPI00119E3CA7|nr:GNAT family N-acetyltransferase [Yersinia rochesterensis]